MTVKNVHQSKILHILKNCYQWHYLNHKCALCTEFEQCIKRKTEVETRKENPADKSRDQKDANIDQLVFW